MPDIRGRRSVLAVALAILTVGAVAVAGSPAGAKAGGAATLKVRKTSLAKVLVDGKGRTVYLFEKDRRGGSSSTCSGACAKAWPPVMTSGAPQAGKGARKS